MNDLFSLQGRVALVTGGSRGIGKMIAEGFIGQGAKVYISSRKADACNATAERLAKAYGGTCVSLPADLSRMEGVGALAKAVAERESKLDILVNNAGVSHWNQKLTEVGEADFDRVYAVNVKSLFWAARHAVPVMAAQGGGAIINIASTAGLRPRPGLCWYNGSKGACIVISKSMAVELAPQKIRVNALCPVAGETPLLAHFIGGDTPENRARFVGTVPLGRLSTPQDVADAALWLASDEARFITGVALEVDGGRCI